MEQYSVVFDFPIFFDSEYTRRQVSVQPIPLKQLNSLFWSPFYLRTRTKLFWGKIILH